MRDLLVRTVEKDPDLTGKVSTGGKLVEGGPVRLPGLQGVTDASIPLCLMVLQQEGASTVASGEHIQTGLRLFELAIPLLGTLITVLLGGYLLHQLRERRQTRYALALRHLQQQLEELYGPLEGMVRESCIIYDVARELLPTRDESGRRQVDIRGDAFNRDLQNIERWRFLVEDYWIPLNRQIVQLLRTKVHLLKEGQMPRSFDDFLKHAVAFEALHLLWKTRGIETNKEVHRVGWPEHFLEDVSRSRAELMARYQECLTELERRA